MGTSAIRRLLMLVLLTPGSVFGQDSQQFPDTFERQEVEFAGITKTLVNLLKTRTPEKIVLGAYEISMEDLIDSDIAEKFDCDSVINDYLSENGENATYEMLSYAMSNTIRERFASDSGDLFVDITSNETPDGLYFNFSISRSRNVSVPIILEASDSYFTVSLDTSCTVQFEANIDLFVNAGMVNADSIAPGISIRINRFAFGLNTDVYFEDQSDDCDFGYSGNTDLSDLSDFVEKPQKTIPFLIEGKKYCAAVRCLSFYAYTYWNLAPSNTDDLITDEEPFYTLTYEQLGKGEFSWENISESTFGLSLIMIPSRKKWNAHTLENNRSEFFYSVDNLFDEDYLERISLCCDYDLREGVTAINKKYILKQ